MVIKTNDSKAWFGDTVFVKPADVLAEALVTIEATPGGEIQGDSPRMLIPFIQTAAEARVTAEGDEIAPSDPVLSQLSFGTVKIAVLTKLSNESLRYGSTVDMIGASAQNAVTRLADHLFINGDPQQPECKGLLQGEATTADAPITTDFKPLLQVLGEIGDLGGSPTSILLSYGTWARLLQITDKDGAPLVSRTVADAPTPQLFGLPVVITPAMPAGKLLVNCRGEVFASASDLAVDVDTSVFFTADSSALRVTGRIGWGCIHEDHLGIVEVAAPTGKATGR